MSASSWHANCHRVSGGKCPAKIRTLEEIHLKAEQRKHSRYAIRKAEFQVFSHGIQITGRLVNISRGGLAFAYLPGPEKKADCRAVDILGPDPDRFYLAGIACRRIYDIGVLVEGRTFTGAQTRLRGIRFTDLTDDQTQKLTDLIDCYGVELHTIP